MRRIAYVFASPVRRLVLPWSVESLSGLLLTAWQVKVLPSDAKSATRFTHTRSI